MIAALALPVEEVIPKGILFFLGAALFFLAPLVLPRLRPRDATIELGAGYVDVKGAGVVSQRIRTRDVVAASTARTEDGVALAIGRRGRGDRPIVLDLANDDDAGRVRDALGIGHFGFGALSWPMKRGQTIGAAMIARVAVAASMIAFAIGMHEEAFLAVGAMLAYVSLPVALVLMAMTAFTSQRQSPSVALRPDALAISHDGRRVDLVAYAAIADAKTTARGIRIDLHDGSHVDVAAPNAVLGRARSSLAEQRHLVAQILSASQRAHGVGPTPPALPERVEALAKRGERGRSWLARLDATAELLAGGSGYRGCGFDENDLWTTLEDHDAPADVRAAAARVLVRVAKDAARPRVEAVIARVRDDDARQRIRVATDDDIDAAGEEIDRIEDREARRRVA